MAMKFPSDEWVAAFHNAINESPDTPLIYVAFGVNVPGARPPGRSGAGAPPAAGAPPRPGR